MQAVCRNASEAYSVLWRRVQVGGQLATADVAAWVGHICVYTYIYVCLCVYMYTYKRCMLIDYNNWCCCMCRQCVLCVMHPHMCIRCVRYSLVTVDVSGRICHLHMDGCVCIIMHGLWEPFM